MQIVSPALGRGAQVPPAPHLAATCPAQLRPRVGGEYWVVVAVHGPAGVPPPMR
jgi:hypothetical protein